MTPHEKRLPPTVDPEKPYCGNCGAQDVPLRKLPYRGCDDAQHICRDVQACRQRRKEQR